MNRGLNKETIENIIKLYQEGKTRKEISEELGIAAATASKYINLYNFDNVRNAPRKRTRTKITKEDIKRINELYSEYKNIRQVAKETGFVEGTVKRYLNEENLKIVKSLYDDRDALFYYIIRLFGPDTEEYPVSSLNLKHMQDYKNKGISYRMQLLSLKYFYEVKKNKVKDEYKTIGIIPYVLTDALDYYKNIYKKQQELEETIKKQLEKDRIEIPYKPSFSRKRKKEIDLNSIS